MGPYGQNLAWSTAMRSCKQAVDAWLEEEVNWTPGTEAPSLATKHFTQVRCPARGLRGGLRSRRQAVDASWAQGWQPALLPTPATLPTLPACLPRDRWCGGTASAWAAPCPATL